MKVALDALNGSLINKSLAALITNYQTNHKANVRLCA